MAAASAAADDDARAAALREQEAGNAAVGRREWDEAAARYTASLALHPTAAAFSNRAAARLALGQADGAVADARAALALDANFVRAFVRLSAAHRALGDDAAALSAAREGLALAERTASPLAAQLREAAAAAGGGAAPRLERTSAETRARFLTACAHCGAALREPRLCGACRQVSFCDAACQRAGHAAHRAACAVAARATASAAAEAGLAAPPRGAQTHALQDWVVDHPAHWHALQTLAWHVQHAPPPPTWGATAASAGAVLFTVQRERTDDATLRVMLTPLSLLRRAAASRGALPAGARARAQGTDEDPQTLGLVASLSRVEVDVGFLTAIEDRRVEVASMARVRYNLPAEDLAELAAQLSRERRLRVDGRELRAEVDVAPFRV
jgi:hypothetical protein